MPQSAMSHYNASTQGIFGKINFCDIQWDGEISHIGVKITENERNQLAIAEIMSQLNNMVQSRVFLYSLFCKPTLHLLK
jgi:hypothetical protein